MTIDEFKEWLTDDEFDKFINNFNNECSLENYLNECDNNFEGFQQAIADNFTWHISPEGESFWEEIYERREKPIKTYLIKDYIEEGFDEIIISNYGAHIELIINKYESIIINKRNILGNYSYFINKTTKLKYFKSIIDKNRYYKTFLLINQYDNKIIINKKL